MEQTKIGAFIAACRKEHDMTQVQFAEKLGVTNKAVSKWETGKCLPDASLFDDICILLNITLNELFAGERITPENVEKKAAENLRSMAAEYQKREYRVISSKYITVLLMLITVSVNVSVGGIWFNGAAVFSNLMLAILWIVSWVIFLILTSDNVFTQKIAVAFNAILLVSSAGAFILAFWDISPQIIYWIGLPCKALFYGLTLICDWSPIYIIMAVFALTGLLYSKNNIPRGL